MKNTASKTHSFINVPEVKIPRSSFNLSKRTLTAFDSANLIPIYLEEVLPGDTFNVSTSSVVRMATPLYPVMDNIYLDIHYFFVPKRLVWTNFDKFHGAEADPGDTNDYLIPKLDVSATPAISEDTIFDYMGLPLGTAATTSTINCLPLRAYNLIYNEFYRDQNLIDSITVNKGDGPDALTDYAIKKRGARSDFYTSLLPAPYKSDDGAVSLPLGSTAPVIGIGVSAASPSAGSANVYETGATGVQQYNPYYTTASTNIIIEQGDTNFPGIYADLSTATAATVDSVIEAFALQSLYRTDARSGTRAFEVVQAHFGVNSPSLQHQYRPEFLGGHTQYVNMTTVPNMSATATENQGDLAAYATSSSVDHSFVKSFTEWGYILGIASVRADRSYQQGLDRIWLRQERFDFYYPGLSNLGEEAIETQEVYWQGNAGASTDTTALGYQERWSHYRTGRNQITSAMRSTHSAPLDAWHLGIEFSAAPTLNQTYIEEQAPIARVVADATAPEFIGDFFFDVKAARPMPTYSIPGMKAIM